MADLKKGFKELLMIPMAGVNTEIKFSRLDAKKVVETMYRKLLVDQPGGSEVEKRLVTEDTTTEAPTPGFGRSEAAASEPKRVFKWFYKGTDQPFEGEAQTEVVNLETGKAVVVAKEKFMTFVKMVPKAIMQQWFIEDVYQIWGDNLPMLLRLSEDLSNNEQVALFKWSPTGTTIFHAFMYPVYDAKIEHFHLLCAVARLKMTTVLGKGMAIAEGLEIKEKLQLAEMMEDL